MRVIGLVIKYEGIYFEMDKVIASDMNTYEAAVLDMKLADNSKEQCILAKTTCNPVIKVTGSKFTNIVSQ